MNTEIYNATGKDLSHTLKQKHHTKERESENERVNKSDKEACVCENTKSNVIPREGMREQER